MAQFCMNCGAELKPGARFCTSCGTAVEPATSESAAAAESAVPAPVASVAPEAPPATPVPAPAPSPAPAAVAAAPAYSPAESTAAPDAPARNNTPWLIGGGLAMIGLAAIASYMVFGGSSPQTAVDPKATPAITQPAAGTAPPPGTAPQFAPGTEPIAGAPAAAVPGAPPAAIPGAPPVGQTSGAAVGGSVLKYVTSQANIRDIATAEAPSRVVGTLKRGTAVQGVMHVGLSGGTYWFKLADGRGFVSAVNLGDAAPGPAPVAAAPPPVASGPTCQVVDRTGSNLRIRNGPNGAVIGGMPNGVRLRWLGEAFDSSGSLWYRVDPLPAGYPTGWVFADHVVC